MTDCYSGDIAHTAGAQQKCVAHPARTARDWQKLSQTESTDFQLFQAIKDWVKRGCDFHRLRDQRQLDEAQIAAEKQWLCDEIITVGNVGRDAGQSKDIASADRRVSRRVAGLC